MTKWQDIVWPEEEGIRLSRVEAREMARKRRQQKREKIISGLVWWAAGFLFIYICLWVGVG